MVLIVHPHSIIFVQTMSMPCHAMYPSEGQYEVWKSLPNSNTLLILLDINVDL